MPAHGKVHRLYKGEVENSLTHRPEGVRLKRYAAGNSIKVYDKHGQVLRVETTLNHPEAFRVYRTPAGQPLPAGNFRVRDGKRRPAVKSSPATRGALAAPAPPALLFQVSCRKKEEVGRLSGCRSRGPRRCGGG